MTETIPDYFEFWTVVITSVVSLVLYFVLLLLVNKRMKRVKQAPGNNELAVYLKRFSGIISFGFLPYMLIQFQLPTAMSDYGSLPLQPGKTFLWIVAMAFIIIPLVLFRGKDPSNLKMYPQIRTENWGLRIYTLSALSWTAYLLSYEFFFRGFLLFASVRLLGPMMAIILNVILYAVAHIPKGKFETLGAIPLGILLCMITLTTGSFWAAFGIHVVMALSNEWVSRYYFKKLKLKIR